MADVKLKVLQFNTLAKHLAEVIQFPYAIDVEKELGVDRGNLYDSWEKYGVTEKHWLYSELSKHGTPRDYLLCKDDCGTFQVEESGGKFIYSWSERFQILISQITRHQPDLIFLQEVEAETVVEFGNALKANIQILGPSAAVQTAPDDDVDFLYDGFYAARSEKPMSDGIALLWKRDSLRAQAGLEPEVLRYSDGQKLALMVPLCLHDASRPFLAVTTHLHWNPVPRPGKPTLQETEAAELIANLDAKGRELFVVLGGDLNCGTQNTAYQLFDQNGFENVDLLLSSDDQKRFSMHVPRAPVPKLTDARCCDQPETTKDNPCLSDYVFIRGCPVSLNGESVSALDTGIASFSPSSSNGLPNQSCSASDHFPIGYELNLGSCSS